MNKLFCKSSEDMSEVADESVHLIVTSPPYNVGMEYEDVLEFDEYRVFLKRIWKECYRVLVDGGRICINIGNTGYKPYIPLHCYLVTDTLELGFLMRCEIIWNKGVLQTKSRMRGSWYSASCPIVLESHEYISVFYKNEFSRENKESTISVKEYKDFTQSVWEIRTESAKQTGHPAPFPVELPRRLIQLYSFKDDVVLDPFMGSGTTALAAKELGRKWVGYDTSPKYVELATQRLRQEMLFD